MPKGVVGCPDVPPFDGARRFLRSDVRQAPDTVCDGLADDLGVESIYGGERPLYERYL